jgi:hypothetical protein
MDSAMLNMPDFNPQKQCLTFRSGRAHTPARVRTAAILLLHWLLLLSSTARQALGADTADRTLGMPLFSDTPLWKETAAAVARRLRLRPASRTETQAIYTGNRVPFLGRTAAELRLIAGRDGTPDAVEINAVNKGDFFNPQQVLRYAYRKYGDIEKAREYATRSPNRLKRDMEREFEEQCEQWEQAISETLTELYGKPDRQTVKRGTRQRLQRWDWDGTAFLLDARRDEFVILRVVPAHRADEAGKSERVSDAEIKNRIEDNVVHEKNGDVLLKNIPMVNQGLKGYCAVATAERILRYYGIRVDSHELAQIASTDKLGGTTWSSMIAAIETVANRNRRNVRTVGRKPSARTVQRYVDKGIPLIWGMFVTDELERAVAERARERGNHDPDEWEKILRKEVRETRRIRPDRQGGHVRIIVGYNRETGEIAYSDSWGNPEPVWMADREAENVSFNGTCLAAVIP